jgi:hypothetical protein
MLGKIRIGLREFLTNVFRSSTAHECATCHTTIFPGEHFTQIDKFKYCVKCREVKAVTAPNNLRTDIVKNEFLHSDKHRKQNEAERAMLHQKEIEEFKALSLAKYPPQAPTPQIEREPTTEPINLASSGDDRENVCVFKIDRFTRSQIMGLDTALLPTIEQQKHA